MEEEIKLTDDEWIRYIGLGLTICKLEHEDEEDFDEIYVAKYIYKNLIDNIKVIKDNLTTLKSL